MLSEPEVILPEGESDFSRESEDKNFTKVVLDDEHNKAFLEEFNEKLRNISSEQDAEKLKDQFKSLTGFDYDELYPVEEVISTDNPDDIKKEAPPVKQDPRPSEVTEEIVDESDELTKADKEYNAKVLNQLAEYYENPEKLKFTSAEIEDMRRLGVFDRETLNTLVEQLHTDIDEIIRGKTDPFSMYADEDLRKQAIKDTLEIKINAQEAIMASRDFVDSGAAQKVFDAKFPKYTERGPASILEEFIEYLNRRTATNAEEQFLIRELNSPKKLKEIIANAEEKLFEGLRATNGGNFTISHFVGCIFRWNKSRLALITGAEESEITLEKFDSVILIFTVLFIRSWYKKYAPNAQTNSLERKLFFQWLHDNTVPMGISGEKTQWLDEAWTTVWNKCADISIKCVSSLTSTSLT